MVGVTHELVNNWAGLIALVVLAMFGGGKAPGFIRGLLADRRRTTAAAIRQEQDAAEHTLSLEELSDSLVAARIRVTQETVETLRRELHQLAGRLDRERVARVKEASRLHARIAQLEDAIRSGSTTVPPWPEDHERENAG